MRFFAFAITLAIGMIANGQEGAPVSPPYSNLKFNLLVGYSFADEVKYEGKLNGTDFYMTEETDPSFGIGFSVMRLKEQGIGFEVGFLYELRRELKKIRGEAGEISVDGTYADMPRFTVIDFFANATYGIAPHTHLFGGFNFPYLDLESEHATLNGALGYQAGIGYQVSKRILGSIQYRVLRGTGNLTNGALVGDTGSIDDLNFNGVVIAAKFSHN